MKTEYFLFMKYNDATVPLYTVAAEYFNHQEKSVIDRKAREQKYPFPVFRAGGQKSQWLVRISDLAAYIDEQAEKGKQLLAANQ